MSEQARSSDDELSAARTRFRDALVKSRDSRRHIDEVEVAAGRFCELLRATGHSPEATLIDAKRVIDEAIDGDSKPIAERAILSCIQHYYGP